MPNTPQQSQALRERCTVVLPGFRTFTPAEDFRRLADWCEAGGIEHDRYGDGPLIQDFEGKIAAMLGKAAATFVPSGVMAQLAAIRVWTERAGLDRFGIHPTSHLARYEEEAFSALMKLHAVPIGDRLRPMTAADLAGSAQRLACVIVELPIREAGGKLPSWEELEALKSAARARGIPLHMDGARLWESAAFYDRPHAAICDGFESVYVSLYKGIGSFAGAMLAGSEDFIAEVRLWRRRMGGTLFQAAPMVAAAAMRFDDRIAMMPALYERTLAFATSLESLKALRVDPPIPHTNMLHLYFDAPVEAVMAARDVIAERHGCWLLGNVRPAEVPGWSVTEIYVGDQLLQIDDARVAGLFRELCEAMAAC